ncbi:MAG: hypothetical protein IKJ59_06155 [Clostridia bacterium]|nr:hypothetical protein [Clostridia bacterium]
MYFIDDEKLRKFEKVMRGVPNFKPRGHGVMVICEFNYEPTEETLKDLITWTMQSIKNPVFRQRLKLYLMECDMNSMEFASDFHRLAFNEAIQKRDTSNYALMSAIYLLTSDVRLYRLAKRYIKEKYIHFDKIKLKYCNEHIYTLYCAAKDLYRGTKYLDIQDLSDPDIIPFKEFGLICNAMTIRRFGIGAVQRERTEE